MTSPFRLALLACFGLYLSGCSAPARVDRMTEATGSYQRSEASPLRNGVAIQQVTGGRGTIPFWLSKVGNGDFEKALEDSLQAAGLWAPKENGRYALVVHLEKLEQPLLSVGTTVTTAVRYRMTERVSGREVFAKTIETPYTANFSQAWLAVERLRIANEGAIRENIKQLINDLNGLNIQGVSVY